jgi:predicted RNA-binding protein associated with RNAse of E/G family
MAKAKIQDAPVVVETAGDLLENVVATEVVAAEVIEVQEAELIAADVFIAENGNEYEFTVKSFLFKGKKYDVTEAVANDADVLEELVKLNSFILKQK